MLYTPLSSVHALNFCLHVNAFYSIGRWFGVIIYWLLIFTVAVVLRNILVAQFSHSYKEQTERAHICVAVIRAKLLHRMESVFWTKFPLKVRTGTSESTVHLDLQILQTVKALFICALSLVYIYDSIISS